MQDQHPLQQYGTQGPCSLRNSEL